MKPFVAYAGWAFALLFAALAIVAFTFYRRAEERTSSVMRDYERLAVQVDRQAEQNAALAETIDAMSAQMEQAQAQMARLQSAAESLGDSEPESGAALLQSFAELMRAASEQGGGPGSTLPRIEETARLVSGLLMSSVSGHVAGAGTALTVDLHYGDFIGGVGLSPEDEDALRSALADAIEREQAGELGGADSDAALADMLSEEQREAFDAYRLRRVREATGAIVETQLALFASGLPAEFRARIREMMEEAVAEAAESEGLPAAPGLESPVFVERYRSGAESAHARLSEAGSEAYRAELERFFGAQKRMLAIAESVSAGRPVAAGSARP